LVEALLAALAAGLAAEAGWIAFFATGFKAVLLGFAGFFCAGIQGTPVLQDRQKKRDTSGTRAEINAPRNPARGDELSLFPIFPNPPGWEGSEQSLQRP
jgi:hypothetical protein